MGYKNNTKNLCSSPRFKRYRKTRFSTNNVQNLDEIKKWRERNTDNLCRLWFFFAVLLLRGKAFDLMVCSSSHCLSEPIYNDARINAKSKTHKNRNRASASDEREQLDVGFFFFYFIFFCYIFLSKYAYPMHVPHYLQTQSRYIIIMSRSWSLAFFFLFAHTSAI